MLQKVLREEFIIGSMIESFSLGSKLSIYAAEAQAVSTTASSNRQKYKSASYP